MDRSATDTARREPTAARRSGSVATRAALRGALWITLGSWVGIWILFGLVVAPTAFRVLPTAEMAGSLIGPVLNVLHLFGAIAGPALGLLAWRLDRGLLQRVLPLAMGAACLYSQFGVSAEIAEIQDAAFGPQGSEALVGRFTQLHRISVGIFLAVGVAALVLTALHARDDARSSR
jgi:hypothetical protein